MRLAFAVFANARARALLGRDPVGEPLGELPAGARRDARARWASTSSSCCATRTRARCARCSTTRPPAIFLKDPDGRYLLVNRAFERLHGAARGRSCVGRLDREVLPPEVAERMRIDDLRVMSERQPIELQEEVTPRRADADLPVASSSR